MSRIIAENSSESSALYQQHISPLRWELTHSSFNLNTEIQPLEALLDGLTTHFVEQAASPTTLAALSVGGLAYRLGRIGTLAIGEGHVAAMPLRILSMGVGLGSEVTAFELTNRALQSVGATGRSPLQNQSPVTNHRSSNLWSWSGPGGLREGLFSSFLTFGLLRGAGSLARDQNIVFQHAFQSAAMVAGHQTASVWGLTPRPEGNLARQFLEAEATNLQLSAGMGLAHAWAPGVLGIERSLDLSLQSFDPSRLRWEEDSYSLLKPSFSENLAFEMGALREPFPKREDSSLSPHKHIVYSVGSSSSGNSSPNLPTPKEARELSARFLLRFPSTQDPMIYSDEIIERVLSTPSEIPSFHERLLEALSQTQPPGTLSQRHTADAIKRVFHFDSLHTATGTLENALLQLLIGQMMLEENPIRRNVAFRDLFQAMEQGLSRPLLEDLFSRWGSLEEWRSTTSPLYPPSFSALHEGAFRQELANYTLRQKVQILHFLYQEFPENPARAQRAMEYFGEARDEGRYDPVDIDAALQYAHRVPFGRVVLRRMLSIFLTQDIPAKLLELTETFNPAHNTLTLVREGRRHGMEPETLAKAINGSRHTAYLKDLRLARKVVAVAQEMASYFERPLEDRKRDRNRFYQVIQTFLRSGAELTPEALMDLINVNPTLQTQQIRERWRSQAFQLRLPPDSEMDELLKKWGHVPLEVSHLFYGAEGQIPPQILMRPFPPPAPNTPADSFSRNVQLTHRGRGVIHEYEHWRHFTGRFEGIEAGGEAFPILGLGREGRLTTEIMALLEDNRWVTLNVTDTDWEIAQRLGLNLPLYFRALADHGYFGRTNERLAREW